MWRGLVAPLKHLKLLKELKRLNNIGERSYFGEGSPLFLLFSRYIFETRGDGQSLFRKVNRPRERGLANTGNTGLSLSVFGLGSVCVLDGLKFRIDGKGDDGILGNISNFIALAAHAVDTSNQNLNAEYLKKGEMFS